ncbi:hypothetical protein CLONEX_02040, partial [[Clostridium] nexile DSM 1787]
KCRYSLILEHIIIMCLKRTRDEFRATKNHNTVCVNDQNQAEILGPFLWGKRYKINNIEFDNECEKNV